MEITINRTVVISLGTCLIAYNLIFYGLFVYFIYYKNVLTP
uniref:Uncharacterized protein n=1 Tax=viral metagenome TaxID=1070528 RepID=A0A6C0J350_9ZZZZ